MGKTQAGPASGTKGVQESSLGQPSQVDVVQKPVEMLLVGASSPDPFSTIVVDPRTGVSAWSYKGSELQGASAGRVVPLGSNGDHFLIAVKDRPLLSCLAVHNRDRFHAKSVVAGPISSLVSSRDGTLLFVAIATKIYIYLLTTGELLSVVDAHYQPIARLGLSSDEALLVSASNDGAVHVYLVSELVSTDRERNVKPLRKWQAHTLPIRGLSVGLGQDPRIATCGIDHTATVHSISLDSSLLKISADRPLTSCTLDPAESRLFVGSDLGNIAQINLYSVGLKSEILIQTSDERNESVPVFNSHSDEISGLAINGDGALLASGDVTGKYCLWEIGSRQCLRVSTMRGAISTLSFIPNWPTLSSSEHTTVWRPVFDLHRNPSDSGNVQLAVRRKDNHDMARWSSLVDRLLETQSGQLVDSSKAMKTKKTTEQTASSSSQNGIDDEIQLVETPKKATSSESIDNEDDPADERIKKLLEENKKLRKINAELYSFAAKTIME